MDQTKDQAQAKPNANDKGGYRQINKSLNICAFEDYLESQTARLPPLADVEQCSPRVLRVLGQNPGKFTLQGTNTYIVGTGHERALIDTGGGSPEWAELVATTLQQHNIRLSHVLLTHWHGDHTGGVPDLLRLYPDLSDSIYKHTPDRGQQAIADNQKFVVAGATIRAVHSPGHSEDHMCFVLEEERAMFTGDNILGVGTSAVEDLGIFMQSLRKMQAQACQVGYSAHGSTMADLPAKIAQELAAKTRRERQVLQTLQRLNREGVQRVTVKELVARMYGGGINSDVAELALEPFMDEVLRKLAADGKVAFEKRKGVKRWFELAAPRNRDTEKDVHAHVAAAVPVSPMTGSNSMRSAPAIRAF
ncbi:hypothetical protein A1O3_02704 [Capronia epimyces CBS 606.96]|uniref:Metallo-beta-lactamase domain-containing protein n=1 Tax=Capronia epimyces CBS 606.96 TaxID=1182542 RepID=W9Y9V7_9EURO|nr:uncharacterized protein A1O3_02704 [Capronia epimyces CBS 606.96]EXJ89637.1 hypothetical protein A1O3_02704 [Capronia epimyces CBS 606.96]